jgi:hypothetical protein
VVKILIQVYLELSNGQKNMFTSSNRDKLQEGWRKYYLPLWTGMDRAEYRLSLMDSESRFAISEMLLLHFF